MTWRNIVLAVFGAWFIVSPFVLHATTPAFLWTAVILGALILIGAIWDLMSVEGH
ncbi:MAG: SPW repeat protein, partial [Firmicutes bacterium]|nr:SPW repeat protein [Bacillota bacterium]